MNDNSNRKSMNGAAATAFAFIVFAFFFCPLPAAAEERGPVIGCALSMDLFEDILLPWQASFEESGADTSKLSLSPLTLALAFPLGPTVALEVGTKVGGSLPAPVDPSWIVRLRPMAGCAWWPLGLFKTGPFLRAAGYADAVVGSAVSSFDAYGVRAELGFDL